MPSSSTNARLLEIPDDGAEAAVVRVERSQVIRQPGHWYLLLVEESVLYFQLGTAEAAAAQLGHLLSVGALPAVSLGIPDGDGGTGALAARDLPHLRRHPRFRGAPVRAGEHHEAGEIGLYLKAFEQLQSMAVYGADARALIVKAIDALT